MKNIAVLFFSLFVLCTVSDLAIAQQKAVTSIASVRAQGSFVNITLTSSKPFIFANNRYILHIANKEFYSSRQSFDKNGIGSMIFMVPDADFNALSEGADIYLTYGKVSVDGKDMDAMSKAEFAPFWSLGKFSKTLLTK